MMAAAVTNPNKALWEKGDFTKIAAFMRESGEAVVRSLGITPQLRVLDLGCGDGTTAVPLATLGAEVVGIDIARNLVEAGNKRAAEAGLNRLKFQEGDACNLQGVDDHSFDLTLSMFGAMFAPKPFDVAREMVRVTKPGGRIVMGNWIPNDPTFVSQVLKISSLHASASGRFRQSDDLGRGRSRHRALRPGRSAKENISMTRDTYHFMSPDKSPAEFIELFRRFYGPTMNAFEAAEQTGGEDLHSQLVDLAKAQNKSANGGTSIPATSCASLSTFERNTNEKAKLRTNDRDSLPGAGARINARSEALAVRLEAGAAALAAFATTLSETEWQMRLPKDGRKVGVVVHHVASMYPVEIQLASLLAAGRPITGVTWDAVATMNRDHAEDE